MSKQGIPDAWDDDWVNVADTSSAKEPEAEPKLSKAQRRQQHLEQQRQLWDGAENPARNLWLETQGVVPNKQGFKPQVQLLSRKPAAPAVARKDGANGIASLQLDDEEDSEEEARKKQEAGLEERKRKALLEREEKQRRYDEARERIMGPSNAASPAPPASRESSHGRDNRRSRQKMNGKREARPSSSADQSPSRVAKPNGNKQLFDPDDMGRRLPKRDQTSTPKEEHPSRQPRGPESGGGGFGVAARGEKPAS